MAPDAVERAAFEKNGRPDAGPVVERVCFQFKYKRSFHVFASHSGTIVIITLVILMQPLPRFHWQNSQAYPLSLCKKTRTASAQQKQFLRCYILFDLFDFGFDVYVRAAEADLADVRAVGDGGLEVQFASKLTDDAPVSAHGVTAEFGDLLICGSDFLPGFDERAVVKVQVEVVIVELLPDGTQDRVLQMRFVLDDRLRRLLLLLKDSHTDCSFP